MYLAVVATELHFPKKALDYLRVALHISDADFGDEITKKVCSQKTLPCGSF